MVIVFGVYDVDVDVAGVVYWYVKGDVGVNGVVGVVVVVVGVRGV